MQLQEREGEEDEKFDRTDARNANDEGDGGDEEEQEQPEPKKSKSDAKPKVNKSAGKKMGDGSGVSNKIEVRVLFVDRVTGKYLTSICQPSMSSYPTLLQRIVDLLIIIH